MWHRLGNFPMSFEWFWLTLPWLCPDLDLTVPWPWLDLSLTLPRPCLDLALTFLDLALTLPWPFLDLALPQIGCPSDIEFVVRVVVGGQSQPQLRLCYVELCVLFKGNCMAISNMNFVHRCVIFLQFTMFLTNFKLFPWINPWCHRQMVYITSCVYSSSF